MRFQGRIVLFIDDKIRPRKSVICFPHIKRPKLEMPVKQSLD
jgi:hypothetical protein